MAGSPVFALDEGRTGHGQSLVVLLEPGTGEAIEIPLPFLAFHDSELVEFADAALAADFFAAWACARAGGLPLRTDQCVGYPVPLFLGGRDVVGNREVIDLDGYWTLCAQLRSGAKTLEPGTSISGLLRAEGS